MEPDTLRRFMELKLVPAPSEADARLLLRFAVCRQLRKGKTLFYQSDRADGAHLLLSGSIEKIKYRTDESLLLIGRAEPGDWLGIPETVLDSPCLHDALAAETSDILTFSRANFMQVLKLETWRDYFFKDLSRQYYSLHTRMEYHSPLARLKKFIRENAVGPERAVLRLTQEQLSQMIGVTRETVNKYLNRMAERGLIAIGRGSLEVLDAKGLDAFRE